MKRIQFPPQFVCNIALIVDDNKFTKMISYSIRQAKKMMDNGTLKPSDLSKYCLSRIENLRELNAFISVISDKAILQAFESDERYRNGCAKGLLDGIPIAVKDNFCTKGVATTCGSKMLKNFIPPYSATVVNKLNEAGAVLLGKCNMDEFAMGCGTVDSPYGPTKNLWGSKCKDINSTKQHKSDAVINDWFISGGSSGGSAVAVASGAVFAALGSDTGGSTRNPAAYCGVVGLKPSYGLISRHGLIPLVNSMDVPGILTRTVDDATTMLNVLAGHDQLDSTTIRELFQEIKLDEEPSIKYLKVGIPKEYHCDGLSREVLDVWTEVANLFERSGAEVHEVSLPHTPVSVACYSVLNQCEVASNMARYDGIEFGLRSKENHSTEQLFAASRSSGFGNVVRGRILAGNYFLLQRNYLNYFVKAMKVRQLIAKDFLNVWASGIEILLTPVTLTDAPKYSDFIHLDNRQQCSMQDYCTQPANLAGLPAISVPIRLSEKGLPISLQLLVPTFQERKLLNVANWIENSVNFPKAKEE